MLASTFLPVHNLEKLIMSAIKAKSKYAPAVMLVSEKRILPLDVAMTCWTMSYPEARVMHPARKMSATSEV